MPRAGSLYREHFLLDPHIGHLNHGAYGATPVPVLERQWAIQREMERSPVEFHARRWEELLLEARRPICDYLGTRPENCAFVVNSTTGANWVAHSLPLGPGDEVLCNDHEYGAVWRCWKVQAQARGFGLRMVEVESAERLLPALQAAAGPRTRALVVSHLTSPTAQHFDVEAVGAWARSQGIYTLVDGAHAPGHLPLQLDRSACDFYVGNLHKWLWAPKGAAVLWARPEVQSLVRPLIVSWGVESPVPLREPDWVALVQMQATRDPSAFLAAPAGLDYQLSYHEPVCETSVYRRLENLSAALSELGAEALPWSRPVKMRAFGWPYARDPEALRRLLFETYRVEVPVYRWREQVLFRVSLQHYVADQELERLLDGLSKSRVAPGPN